MLPREVQAALQLVQSMNGQEKRREIQRQDALNGIGLKAGGR